MTEQFERHARTVSMLTLISRLTGLARVTAVSRIFGAGALVDALFFAFMIPHLFRRLFGEGALAAAFLPVYTQLDRDDPQLARQLASLTIAGLIIVLGAMVVVVEIVLFLVSSRFGHEQPAVWLLMIMLPYAPMVCIVAILGAMLQVHGRFGPPAAAPIVANICFIGAAVGLTFVIDHDPDAAEFAHSRLLHVGGVAVSVVVAGAIQIVWALLALRDQPWWTMTCRAAREPMGRVLRQAGPMIVGLGVLQLNTLFDGLIASYPTAIGSTIFGVPYPLESGAMASVTFAQRLWQFPLGVFGIAIATAIFPALARQVGDSMAFLKTVRRGLRLVIYIGIPASVGMILVRVPMTRVILEGGDFLAADTARVASIACGYAPAVGLYSLVHVLTRAFYARGDARTPVRIALGVVGLNLVLNCTLIWSPLREAGLAWSTTICGAVQAVLLMIVLQRLHRGLGRLIDRTVVSSWLRTAAATIVMGVAVVIVARAIPEASTWSRAAVLLLGQIVAGIAVYLAMSVAMRMTEWRWVAGRG